jgi:signal transduction histidine kinase
MRLYFFAFIFFLFIQSAYCQPTSIKAYKQFFRSGKVSADKRDVDKLMRQGEEAIEIGDQLVATRRFREAGLLHLTRSRDYEKALDQFIRCLSIEDSMNFSQEKVITQIAIAEVNEQVGDLDKSLEMLESALETNRILPDTSALIYILLKIGNQHHQTGRLEEAAENFRTAQSYSELLGDESSKSEALYELGSLFATEGKHEQALKIHKEALAIRRKLGDRKNEAQSLNTIGELYLLMKNFEKALANHEVALEIRNSLKDASGIAESFIKIGEVCYEHEEFQRAVANLELGLTSAHEAQEQQLIRRCYELLSLCYKATGDFQNSLKNKERFIAITELILNERNEQQILAKQNLYVVKRKEIEIDRLQNIRRQREQKIAEQKTINQFLFAILAAGFIIAGLVVWLYILKRRSNRTLILQNEMISRQNNQLQEANATKDKFFSIISHDLKGPLNSLTSFSSLLIHHTDSLTKDEIQLLAKDLDKSLKNLFDLLENLLEWSRSQTGNIDFRREEFDLGELIHRTVELLAVQAKNKEIGLTVSLPDTLMVCSHRHSVNTVVRNLISNAVKFTRPGGSVGVSAKVDGESVTISVSDTGVGMPPEILEKLFRIDTKHSTKGTADEKGTGLGLILCKDFVEKNDGKIWVQSEVGKGSVFHFTLLRTAPKVPTADLVAS